MQLSINLPEDQIQWLKDKQKAEDIHTSFSRVIQKIIATEIRKDNANA